MTYLVRPLIFVCFFTHPIYYVILTLFIQGNIPNFQDWEEASRQRGLAVPWESVPKIVTQFYLVCLSLCLVWFDLNFFLGGLTERIKEATMSSKVVSWVWTILAPSIVQNPSRLAALCVKRMGQHGWLSTVWTCASVMNLWFLYWMLNFIFAWQVEYRFGIGET